MVDYGHGRVARLAGIERAADSGYGSSPWCNEKQEVAKGVLTTGLLG
jgi:hypothetical protein